MTDVLIVDPSDYQFMEISYDKDNNNRQYIPLSCDKPIMLTVYINNCMYREPQTKVYIYKNIQDFITNKDQIKDICSTYYDYCFVTTVEELVFHEPNV